jgi:hypothetical protein
MKILSSFQSDFFYSEKCKQGFIRRIRFVEIPITSKSNVRNSIFRTAVRMFVSFQIIPNPVDTLAWFTEMKDTTKGEVVLAALIRIFGWQHCFGFCSKSQVTQVTGGGNLYKPHERIEGGGGIVNRHRWYITCARFPLSQKSLTIA